MIKALIFDLDGTLVQTEALKAKSYAIAAHELDPSLTEGQVIHAFKDFVGLTRREVAEGLLKRFNLEGAAAQRMKETGAQEPWQTLVDIRMEEYFSMISDPELVKAHLCPHSVGLLKWARSEGYPIGLGTMSHRNEAFRVLEVIDIKSDFDFIATIEDVNHGKPDPEIYNLLASELEVNNQEALVVEDSSTGIRAALAASMNCIAVTTELTREAVHELPPDESLRVIDEPSELLEKAQYFINNLSESREKTS